MVLLARKRVPLPRNGSPSVFVSGDSFGEEYCATLKPMMPMLWMPGGLEFGGSQPDPLIVRRKCKRTGFKGPGGQ